MIKKHPKPTESELQILRILWTEGPSTVREVNNVLGAEKQVGYTTTLKLMQIMAEKNLVNRNTSSKTHIYKANILEHDTQKSLIKSLVDQAFGGSAMELVLQALGNHKTTSEELDQIKELISQLENVKK